MVYSESIFLGQTIENPFVVKSSLDVHEIEEWAQVLHRIVRRPHIDTQEEYN